LAIPAVLTCFALATAQSIAPDEIRSRTVPYVPPSTVTLRTEVRVVEVPVVVRDGQGRAVAGLTKDDFEIQDQGKKQTITAFSVQSSAHQSNAAGSKDQPRPRFLALCFDDLHLVPAALIPVKEAAERFVKTALAPGDRVAVVTTSQLSRSAFTDDVPKLLEQIAKVTSSPRAVFDDSQRCLHILPHEAYQIANNMDPGDQVLHAKVAECSACSDPRSPCHEAVVTAAAQSIWAHAKSNTVNTLSVIDSLVDGMAKLPGQRIILLTSAGFLTGTLESDLDRLMDKARHAEVVINALDARGVYLNLSEGMAFDGMGSLAVGTGGAFYHNQNDLVDGLRELGMAPETMYVLGFAPSGLADGRFHKLKVQFATGKRYSLQARLGYTALAANSAEGVAPVSKLDREVTASDTIADLPVSFTWEQWAGPPGITMIAHLDLNRFQFKPWQDRRTQRLTIVAILLDSQGSFVAGKRSELELSLRASTFAQFEKTSFPVALTLNAPPGTYSVRALAQDAMEGKLAAASGAVQVK
jgi:VWFA-related protein